MSGVVISLCDYTGTMVKPWVDHGYRAILVDPQHIISHDDGPITKLAMTVEQAAPLLGEAIQDDDVAAAEQCRMVGALSGAPWMVENPVSILSSVWGQPRHTFHPWQFTGWAPQDNYRKLTCLWTGGGFRMPAPHVADGIGDPDDRIHKAPPGPERANFRSATPAGFAQAVFYANTRQEAAA